MNRFLERAREAFRQRPLTGALWLATLIAIPTISYYGRRLEHLLRDNIGRAGIGWALAVSVVAVLILAGYFLVRSLGPRGLLHLLWMLLLAAGLMYYLRRHPARWYHIPLFGAFGFLSVRLFSVRTGAEIAFAFAVLDEVFQHYLPDRVGDFEDIIVNAVCAGAGIVLYLIVRRSPSSAARNTQKGD